MKIICVTGAMSGVGKTLLAEKLLTHLKNWAACKVTTYAGGEKPHCTREKDLDIGVYNSLKENYSIEERINIIEEKGTDTARLRSAGAKKVLWIKARPRYMKRAVQEAVRKLNRYEGVLFEGNHALMHLKPDIAVMIQSKDNTFKRSAKQVKNKIDVFTDFQSFDGVIKRIVEAVN